MSFINPGAYDSLAALALATSANGTDRNGTALQTFVAHPGTIVAECTSEITTASVVATFKMQVSTDNSTWYDLKLPNNAANVSTAAGTGSAVTTRLALHVPDSASSYKYFRVVATLSGATTAAADKTSVTYRYLRFAELE